MNVTYYFINIPSFVYLPIFYLFIRINYYWKRIQFRICERNVQRIKTHFILKNKKTEIKININPAYFLRNYCIVIIYCFHKFKIGIIL